MKTTALVLISCLLTARGVVADGIPAHQAKSIYDAAPAEARVIPKQARRVLIWNTPDHLYGPPYDRSKLRVLLSLDPATSNMEVPWINRSDNDFALAWVKSYGQGRVFNTSFGHRTELFWDRRVLAFYLDAIQFACGDLEGPTTPRADRPVRRNPGSEPAPGLPGFVSLFNGRDLAGWQGDPRIWSVREGAIVGETTDAVRVTENQFLIWKDEIEDFELRLQFRLQGGNSGV